jgi:hypothetical protein
MSQREGGGGGMSYLGVGAGLVVVMETDEVGWIGLDSMG